MHSISRRLGLTKRAVPQAGRDLWGSMSRLVDGLDNACASATAWAWARVNGRYVTALARAGTPHAATEGRRETPGRTARAPRAKAAVHAERAAP
jgi:hypothetical protein